MFGGEGQRVVGGWVGGWGGLENISLTGEVTLKVLQSIVFGASAAT